MSDQQNNRCHLDRISNLRLFIRLAETLSFSETAASLNIARSSVSRVIGELEDELGVRLIQRSTRKVALTPNGTSFQKRCAAVIREVEAIAGMFQTGHTGPKGKLRVNAPTRLARLVITPALPEFLQLYPDIELDFAATDRPVDLIGEGFDCVIRVGQQKDSGLLSRKIAELRMVNCASPQYLAAHGTPQTLNDLEGHKAVGYVSPRNARDTGWDYTSEGKSQSMRMKCMLRVNNAELYVASCLAGLGLIQVPAYDVQPLLESGQLVAVIPDHPAPPMPVAIVSPDRASLNPTIQVFADWAAVVVSASLRSLPGNGVSVPTGSQPAN